MPEKRAVVLLSGGLDSTTSLYIAKSESFEVHALSCHYGQLHVTELDAARRVANLAGAASHRVVTSDFGSFGGSALTDPALSVPKHSSTEEIESAIPCTYVPARNTILLGMAVGLAEVVDASDVFIGVNHLDSSGYPDCRPEFLRAFEATVAVGTRAGVEGRPLRIRAPLIDLDKAGIIRKGLELGVDYSITRSCYDPDESGAGCRRCDACLLRLAGFAANGAMDPAPYVEIA